MFVRYECKHWWVNNIEEFYDSDKPLLNSSEAGEFPLQQSEPRGSHVLLDMHVHDMLGLHNGIGDSALGRKRSAYFKRMKQK